jgi:hypothetical protein
MRRLNVCFWHKADIECSRIEPMPFLADRLNSEQQDACFDVHYGTGIALPGQGSGP